MTSGSFGASFTPRLKNYSGVFLLQNPRKVKVNHPNFGKALLLCQRDLPVCVCMVVGLGAISLKLLGGKFAPKLVHFVLRKVLLKR